MAVDQFNAEAGRKTCIIAAVSIVPKKFRFLSFTQDIACKKPTKQDLNRFQVPWMISLLIISVSEVVEPSNRLINWNQKKKKYDASFMVRFYVTIMRSLL